MLKILLCMHKIYGIINLTVFIWNAEEKGITQLTKYILMHKRTEVAYLELNDTTGWIQRMRTEQILMNTVSMPWQIP